MAIRTEDRFGYLDNVRTVMTILVLVVHAAITYGSEGGWYYQEPTGDLLTVIPLTLISAVSQSFFMSLLFFLSAYFTSASIERKGAPRFMGGRLLRLGVPYLLFVYGVGPLTLFVTSRFLDNEPFAYAQSIHVGPLWFVQALMIFTFAYVVIRQLARRKMRSNAGETPERRLTPSWLVWLGVSLAAATFIARWAYPIGTGYWGMQFGSFPQYAVMFTLGILARKRNWLDQLDRVRIRPLLGFAGFMVVALPVAMFLGADTEHGFEFFLGGPYWQAVVYAIWESVMCVAMSLLVLAIFRRKTSGTTQLSKVTSRSAFAVYIVHPVVLVALAALMVGLDLHPLLKFVALASVGCVLSFVAGTVMRKLPALGHVL